MAEKQAKMGEKQESMAETYQNFNLNCNCAHKAKTIVKSITSIHDLLQLPGAGAGAGQHAALRRHGLPPLQLPAMVVNILEVNTHNILHHPET